MNNADESSAAQGTGGMRISSIDRKMLAALSNEVRFQPTRLDPAQGIAVVSASFRKRHSKVSSYFFSDIGVETSARENATSNSETTGFLTVAPAQPSSRPSENLPSAVKPAIGKDDHRTHLKNPP